MVGQGSQEASLRGEGGPIVEGQPATTAFRGTLNLRQVGISDLSKFFNSPALRGTDGTLTGETKINSESGKLTARGETNVQNAKVRGMELGYPIAADEASWALVPSHQNPLARFFAIAFSRHWAALDISSQHRDRQVPPPSGQPRWL